MKIIRIFVFLLLTINSCFAQTPSFKVDLNIGSRQSSEVNDPNFIAWPINTVNETLDTIQGVIIKFRGLTASLDSATLTSSWYKAGVQSPNYARLSCDGIVATALLMTIHGLPAGTHTLLTYHNTYDSPTAYVYNPIKIYLNDKVMVDSLMPSNREVVMSKVPIAYLTFNVNEGEDAVFRFMPRPTTTSTFNKVTLSGFELNTPNSMHQAYLPFPSDRDEHVDGDAGKIQLKWYRAITSASHDLYIGTDSTTVANATHTSTCFKGNQTDTIYNNVSVYNLDKYYWRVDEKASDGTITKGNTWYFRNRKLAFPGAEGYGRYAIGGRGGKVVEVTNLNDDGPGSLREAVTSNIGPRTIVFTVSGIITLNSRLATNNSYITVAGQTAPGKGICIRRAPFGLSGGTNAIIQNVRVRLGSGTTYDGMGMAGANYGIFDHCSISWTIDEAFSSRNAKNITLQRTLISEALNIAGHQNYPAGTKHGYAATIGGDAGSFHHNLLAHCEGRNWSMGGGLDGNGYYAGRLDIFNNVVYNWGGRANDGGAHEVNFVNNYYKRGPANGTTTIMKAQLEGTGKGTQSYYYAGNIYQNNNGSIVCDGTDNTCSRTTDVSGGQVVDWTVFVNTPFFPSYATIQAANDAYKSVLSDVGCTQPVFDDHDKRIIKETLAGSYTYTGSISGVKGLPDTDQDVGSWEDYPNETRAANFDTDHDGLPDWWEKLIGTNTNSATGDFSDSNADADKNGYTNLEEYLQWLMLPHYEAKVSTNLDIDLGQYSSGYTSTPIFTILGLTNCSVSMVSGTKTARFTSAQKGLAKFNFTVTDAAGSTMTRSINVLVGDNQTTLKNVNQLNVSVYPNPAVEKICISGWSEIQNLKTISITNSTGQKIIEKMIVDGNEDKLWLDVTGLKPGVYFVSVGKNSTAGRFIKL
jgi:hypothetical protein